jgi:hypothetical protein
MLHLIPDFCYNQNESLEEKAKALLKEVDNKELDHNSWWYLHGELDDLVGYDKGTFVNCKSEGLSRQTVRWLEIRGNRCTEYKDIERYELYANGIFDVFVEVLNIKARAYLWTTEERMIQYTKPDGTIDFFPHWVQRGLVVLPDDKEGNEDAVRAYMKKAINI